MPYSEREGKSEKNEIISDNMAQRQVRTQSSYQILITTINNDDVIKDGF